jgi:hypothetical protein
MTNNWEPIDHIPPLKRIDLNPVRKISGDPVAEKTPEERAEIERIWGLVQQSADGIPRRAADPPPAASTPEPVESDPSAIYGADYAWGF